MLLHMKTVTIRQVHHDFSAVLALVAQGEEVTVLNRTRPVARICPPLPQAPAHFKMPDFAARAKAIFGDRIIPNIVLEEREASRWQPMPIPVFFLTFDARQKSLAVKAGLKVKP